MPVVRFCIKRGVRFQDFSEIAKGLFVAAAQEEIEQADTKVTSSRLSAMTGLQRREVTRTLSNPSGISERDVVVKVVGLWQTGTAFLTKAKEPRVLSYVGEQSEFASLVRAVSKDMNSATILFELERLHIVEKSDRGVRLILDTVSPRGDIEGGLKVLGDDITDLVAGVEENLLAKKEIPNLHVRTHYDNIRADALPEIRSWLLREGHAFHAKAREMLAQHDQDINPNPKYKGEKAVVTLGAFSCTAERREK